MSVVPRRARAPAGAARGPGPARGTSIRPGRLSVMIQWMGRRAGAGAARGGGKGCRPHLTLTDGPVHKHLLCERLMGGGPCNSQV